MLKREEAIENIKEVIEYLENTALDRRRKNLIN
jgi:predicted RNase H-like HicB family nuclease